MPAFYYIHRYTWDITNNYIHKKVKLYASGVALALTRCRFGLLFSMYAHWHFIIFLKSTELTFAAERGLRPSRDDSTSQWRLPTTDTKWMK